MMTGALLVLLVDGNESILDMLHVLGMRLGCERVTSATWFCQNLLVVAALVHGWALATPALFSMAKRVGPSRRAIGPVLSGYQRGAF
jgi:hypothetical protein